MSIFFTRFPIIGLGKTMYTRIREILQECGILLGGSFKQLDDCPTSVIDKVWE